MDEAELCDTLGFIYQGRLIAQGSPAHIKTDAFKRTVVEVEADELRRAGDALTERPEIEEVVRVGSRLRLIMADGFGPDDVRAFLAEDGILANWIQEVEPSVEDLFVSFVDKERKVRLREQLRAL
jgi:ABC-2 type transport system ATP-binding protein